MILAGRVPHNATRLPPTTLMVRGASIVVDSSPRPGQAHPQVAFSPQWDSGTPSNTRTFRMQSSDWGCLNWQPTLCVVCIGAPWRTAGVSLCTPPDSFRQLYLALQLSRQTNKTLSFAQACSTRTARRYSLRRCRSPCTCTTPRSSTARRSLWSPWPARSISTGPLWTRPGPLARNRAFFLSFAFFTLRL